MIHNNLSNSSEYKNGILYIIPTPIGNMEDITFRALRILKTLDAVICEDSRITNYLLQYYGINKKLIICNDHTSEKVQEKIICMLNEGKSLGLVSDAGTPLISDPGYKLLQLALAYNITVIPLPGPSALITALSASGLSTNKFTFLGFLPHKDKAIEELIIDLQNINGSIIFYENPNRILNSLKIIRKILGNRKAIIAREMTKLYEEFIRGEIEEIIKILDAKDVIKGEIVLIIEGLRDDQITIISNEEITVKLKNLMESHSLKDASRILAEVYQLPKKSIYKLGLKAMKLL